MIIESPAYPYNLEILRLNVPSNFAELNMIDDSDIYSSGREIRGEMFTFVLHHISCQ